MTYDELLAAALRVQEIYDQLNMRDNGSVWDGDRLMAGFVGDVGELSKIIMAKSGHRAMSDVDEKLKHELSDCLWSILILAHHYNVDLGNQFIGSMGELVARLEAELKK